MAEIIPYRIKLIPPMMEAGREVMTCANFGTKDSTMA